MKMFLKAWFFVTIPLLGVLFISVGYAQVASLRPPTASIISVPPKPKPNIVIFYLDDLRLEQQNYLPMTKDYFEDNGTIFTRSYTNISWCCPARASLLTGLYAHNHEIVYNFNAEDKGYYKGGEADFRKLGHEEITFAKQLQDNGYTTSLIGKYLNGYGRGNSIYIPSGWDDWHAFYSEPNYFDYKMFENGVMNTFGNDPEDYSTDVIRNRTIQFVKTAKEPFLAYVNPYTPHTRAIPAPRHGNLYSAEETKVPRKPNFGVLAKNTPRWQQLLEWTDKEVKAVDDEYWRAANSLASVDEMIRDVINQLEASGRLDNTVIMVSNDNGTSRGAHKWDEKRCPSEECLRTPFAIYVPGVAARKETKELISTVDITATIFDLARVTPKMPINGKSVLPLLTSGVRTGIFRDAILAEGWALPHEEYCGPLDDATRPRQGPGDPGGGSAYCGAPTFKTVVSYDNYKYTEVNDVGGKSEFYDLNTDPYELNNRIDDPTAAPIIARLKPILERMVNE